MDKSTMSILELAEEVKEYAQHPRYERLRSLWERHWAGELTEKMPIIVQQSGGIQ